MNPRNPHDAYTLSVVSRTLCDSVYPLVRVANSMMRARIVGYYSSERVLPSARGSRWWAFEVLAAEHAVAFRRLLVVACRRVCGVQCPVSLAIELESGVSLVLLLVVCAIYGSLFHRNKYVSSALELVCFRFLLYRLLLFAGDCHLSVVCSAVFRPHFGPIIRAICKLFTFWGNTVSRKVSFGDIGCASCAISVTMGGYRKN